MGDFQFFLFSFLYFPPSLYPSFSPEVAGGGRTWPEHINPEACNSLLTASQMEKPSLKRRAKNTKTEREVEMSWTEY